MKKTFLVKLLVRYVKMISIVVLISLITTSSIFSIYSNREVGNRLISKVLPGSVFGEDAKTQNNYWAKKILNQGEKNKEGGYILHFRHAERDKWLDVHMYDILESKFHENANERTAFGENKYYKKAVCLNDRGMVQAQAMGEIIRKTKLPISEVVSSPSCRARQTAEIAFGGYSELNILLLHEGAFNEDIGEYRQALKNFYTNLKIQPGKNVVISSHNSVINKSMFSNGSKFQDDYFYLEEGGFYVISKSNQGLRLEHKFTNFLDFARSNFTR